MIINDTLFKNMAKTNPILPTTNNKLLAKVLVFFQILLSNERKTYDFSRGM